VLSWGFLKLACSYLESIFFPARETPSHNASDGLEHRSLFEQLDICNVITL
jgi:hypothetical protein